MGYLITAVIYVWLCEKSPKELKEKVAPWNWKTKSGLLLSEADETNRDDISPFDKRDWL